MAVTAAAVPLPAPPPAVVSGGFVKFAKDSFAGTVGEPPLAVRRLEALLHSVHGDATVC